jgi:hypothetical protein
MNFQGLTTAQAEQTWAPFFDWVKARPADYTLTGQLVGAIPAQDWWNAAFFERYAPEVIVRDPLPGAPKDYYYNAGNASEVAAFWSAYQSTWLSQQLLDPGHHGVGTGTRNAAGSSGSYVGVSGSGAGRRAGADWKAAGVVSACRRGWGRRQCRGCRLRCCRRTR